MEVEGLADLMVPEKRYRTEIEGLRTVATLLVAMYHIWFDRVSGGIDVFFVLSGFLITTTLLNRIEKNRKIKLWFTYIKYSKTFVSISVYRHICYCVRFIIYITESTMGFACCTYVCLNWLF